MIDNSFPTKFYFSMSDLGIPCKKCRVKMGHHTMIEMVRCYEKYFRSQSEKLGSKRLIEDLVGDFGN